MELQQFEEARRWNLEAQAQLLQRLQDPWYRLCLSLLGDAESALDATQETALRFVRTLRSFKGQSKLSTWSMGIAINVVREMRRKRKMASTEDESIAGSLLGQGPSPAEDAMSSEDRIRVQALIADLPQRQREAVVLRFFEEMSVEETALVMDCAQGTVKATIHQALRAMRKRLEPIR